MKKALSVSIVCVLAAGVAAMGAPAYSLSWNFEDGAMGGWSAGSVLTNAPFSGTAYPTGKRLYTGDNVASWLVLPQATNSFVYTTQAWTDAGDINGMRKAGMGYRYAANGNTAWFEGVDGGGWPANSPSQMRFGDNSLPNPRPGASTDWADYQWQGGSGRTLGSSTVDGVSNVGGHYLPADNWAMPKFAELELMVKYNTPDNPGTVELWYRSLNYNNPRVAAGQWLRLGWGGYQGAQYFDFILGNDPNTNDIWAIDAIKLGGGAAWSQAAWDNVTFTSIPEPATLSLLVLGGLAMLRRRR